MLAQEPVDLAYPVRIALCDNVAGEETRIKESEQDASKLARQSVRGPGADAEGVAADEGENLA